MDAHAKRAEQVLMEVKLAREAMEASGERGVGEVVDVGECDAHIVYMYVVC